MQTGRVEGVAESSAVLRISDQERLSGIHNLSFWERMLLYMRKAKDDPETIEQALRGMWYARVNNISARHLRVVAGTRINNLGVMELGEAVRFRACEIAVAPGGRLSIGEYTSIGSGTKINVGKEEIKIGPYSLVGWSTDIMSTSFHTIVYPDGRKTTDKPVEIGTHVWVAEGVTILPGAKIGDNSVVAASSVVIGKEYPPKSLIGGNPAKVIESIEDWER